MVGFTIDMVPDGTTNVTSGVLLLDEHAIIDGVRARRTVNSVILVMEELNYLFCRGVFGVTSVMGGFVRVEKATKQIRVLTTEI